MAREIWEMRCAWANPDRSPGEQRRIATQYEVTLGTVYKIVNYKTWPWVTPFIIERLQRLYVKEELTIAETVGALKERGIVWTESVLRSRLKSLGIYRYAGRAHEIQVKKGRSGIALPTPVVFFERGPHIPYDVLRKLYLDELKTREEIVEALKEMEPPIRVSVGIVASRIWEYGLHESQAERTRKYIFEKGSMVLPTNRLKPEQRYSISTERDMIRKAFPAPLGKCQFGDADAVCRFRLDFGERPFVDVETSSDLVTFLCARHKYWMGRKRRELGLPLTLQSGERLLEWLRQNPMPCEKEVKTAECIWCETTFPLDRPNREQLYCSQKCATTHQHRKNYEARIMKLFEKLGIIRKVVREIDERYPHLKRRGKQPTSRGSIATIIREHKETEQ